MERQVPAELQDKVRKAYKALMAKSGGTRRRGQQVMIGEIAKAVANARKLDEVGTGARLLAIDAPTGCGKTYSYALGAIPIALANGLKVIVSTGKVSLMDQLHRRDLAALQEIIPEMRVALVKGRSRYACPVRVEQAIVAGGEKGAAAVKLLTALESGAWSGDVDELPQAPAPVVWAACTNDRAGCASRKCSSYGRCPYFNHRKAAESANVFVTNHDMVWRICGPAM